MSILLTTYNKCSKNDTKVSLISTEYGTRGGGLRGHDVLNLHCQQSAS